MSQYQSTGICHKNKNGGYYIKGDYYNYATKKAVVDKFFEMWEALYPLRPSYNDVAIHMKVSKQTVKNFVNEYFMEGRIIDPMEKKVAKAMKPAGARTLTIILSPLEESFLLSLRAEDPTRTLKNYAVMIFQEFGKTVSTSYLHKWWLHQFQHRGSLRISTKVPINK